MKRGVCTTPWGVWKQPQRARLWLQWAVISKRKGVALRSWVEQLMGTAWRCPDARARTRPLPPQFLPSAASRALPDPSAVHDPQGQPPAPAPDPRPVNGGGWLGDLAGAWIFYSVLPAWPGIRPRFERVARFAPWLGLVLGGLQALLWWASSGWLPAGARAALVIALGLALSGGLHHDGALDTADGLAAGPRRRLEAMADSRVGAAAVQTALQLVLLRGAGLLALAAAPVGCGALALVWAAFWARIAPLLAMEAYPYLRRDGSAAFHRHHWRGLGRELRPALLGGLLLLLASWWLVAAGRPGLLLLLALPGALPALLLPRWLGRCLGGHSGDSYGACVEWSESLGLLLSGLLLAALAPSLPF